MLGSSCMAGAHPRLAETTPRGELSWSAHLPVTTVAVGEVEGTVDTGDATTSGDLTFNSWTGPVFDASAIWIAPIWWTEGSIAYGLFSPCEVGGIGSIARLGGELRCNVLSQRAGAPVALALSGAGAYTPFFYEAGPWWTRGLLEMSLDFGDFVVMGGVGSSYGAEGHSAIAVPEQIHNAPCEDCTDAPAPQLLIVRREWRAVGTVGVGWRIPESPVGFILGISPYAVIDASDVLGSDCMGCQSFEARELSEPFGVGLTLGVAPF